MQLKLEDEFATDITRSTKEYKGPILHLAASELKHFELIS